MANDPWSSFTPVKASDDPWAEFSPATQPSVRQGPVTPAEGRAAPRGGLGGSPKSGDEQTWGEWAKDTLGKLPAAGSAAVRNIGVVGAKANAALSDIADTVTYPIDAAISTVGSATGLYDYDPDKERQRRSDFWARGVDTAEKKVDAVRPKAEGVLQQGIFGGIESVPTSLAAAAAGIVTRDPRTSLAMMGGATGLPAFADARAAGKDFGTALKYAIEQGGVEVLTEKIPASSLVSDVIGKTPFGKTLMKQLAQEIPGEQVATLLQDLSEWATMNPEKSVSEFVAERPSAATHTLIATITGTAIQTGAAKAIDRVPDAVEATGRLVRRRPGDNRTPGPGIREQAEQAAIASITQEDEASALPTADIVRGRAENAANQAKQIADTALGELSLPGVGKRVTIDHGNGLVETGTMQDVFEDETGRGVVIERDGGRPMREYLDNLHDAGVSIRAGEPSTAAEIDAGLAQQAQAVIDRYANVAAEPMPSIAPAEIAPTPAQAQTPGKGKAGPVADGGAIIRSIFGDQARITSTYRDANHPLSKANPRSWHTKSRAAVDIAPIKGMTFDQAKAAIEAQGYNLIEALNETGKGRTKHATGDHWHFVIGEGGPQVAGQAQAGGVATQQPSDSVVAPEPFRMARTESTTQEVPSVPARAEVAAPAIEETAPSAPQPTIEPPRLEPTPSGKSVALIDPTPAQIEAIKVDVPEAKALRRKDGALVYANKYADAIDQALRKSAIETRSQASTATNTFAQPAGQQVEQPQSRADAQVAIPSPSAPALAASVDTPVVPPIAAAPQALDLPADASITPDVATSDEQVQSPDLVTPIETTPSAPTQKREQVASTQRESSPVTFERTANRQSTAIMNITPALEAALVEAIPNVRPLRRKDGAVVYSARHEPTIKRIIAAQAEVGNADSARRVAEQWGNARDRLLAGETDEVRGALRHPELGAIDVKIGEVGTARSDGYGLAKIARFHPEVLDNLPQIIADMDVASRGRNRVRLESSDHKAVVRLDWDGAAQQWLLTAFEKAPSAAEDGRAADGEQDGSPARGTDSNISDKGEKSNPTQESKPQDSAPTEPKAPAPKTADQESRAERESKVDKASDETAESEPRESIPESARDLPTVSIKSSDWGKLPSSGRGRLEILRGRVSRWYDGLIGTTIKTRDGKEVRFNPAGQKKTLRAGEDLLSLARAIPKILERGTLIATQKSNRPGMKAVHRYAANVRDESGAIHSVVAIVREADDGSYHYSLNRYVEESARDASADTDREAKRSFTPALEGNARDILNLQYLDEQSNNAPSRYIDTAALQERLEQIGISRKVALRVVGTLNGAAGDYGAFGERLIRIASDTDQAVDFTLNHEIIHALRDIGLFNHTDWSILAAKAKRDPGLMRSIRKRYPRLSAEAQTEEAVADMFARWQRGDYEATGTVARVFQRLRDMLEVARNVFAGRGARTAEGVMRDVDSGKLSEATETDGASEARQSIPQEIATLADLAGTEPTWKGKAAEAFEKWRTAVQDRYLPLLKVQRMVERVTGKPLPESANPYIGEELMTGRIGSRLEKLESEHVAPLFDAMAAEKVSIEELETYLYARHAPERNARIAEINPEFEAGSGSGMTDIEAKAVMNRITKAGKMEAMKRLAARVDGLRDLALSRRVESGLMSKEQADEWRSAYQFYVPLRGFQEVEGDGALPERINRSGGGINVRGKESKQAFGRRSKADSPIAYTIMQAEEAIVRGETNLVAQKFINLARQAPDADFWEVNKVTTKPKINEASGLVEYNNLNQLLAADANWTVSAKFDGKEVRVTMNKANPVARRLADSMRNLTQQQLDWVTQHLGKVNRFLSAVNTSYNPEFVITNAFRDLQAATINLGGVDLKGIQSGTLRDYRKALVASTKGAFGKGSGEWRRWYDEFTSEGGRVYFNRVEDVAVIKGRMQEAFAMAALKAGEPGNVRLHIKRGLIAARDIIENTNLGVENAIRLSAYKNARERGASKTQAASIAKNITVNFNRRGQMGPAINAAYLFFNASVQGSTRILMAMRSRKVQKMVAGIVIGGALMEMLNAMVSGDDDDGESFYDKIPSHEKSRNIIIMLPGGKEYVKIPMPYGYNAFWEAGRGVSEIARRGGDRWQESAGNLLSTAVDAFNPVGGSDTLLNFIAPTIADPIVDLALNRDFTGKPIMPQEQPYGPPDPDNQRYFGSIGTHWKAITDFLNEATGGDEVVAGSIDVSPETLEYLAGTVFGAAGAFADRVISARGKWLDGTLETNDIPFARKVMGKKSAWQDKGAFWDRMNEVDQVVKDAKDYIEIEQIDRARDYARDNISILALEGDAKRARKDMRDIRKARREIEAGKEDGTIDAATAKDYMGKIDTLESSVVQGFNTRWNESLYGPKQ